mgnify:CR=1 FL=1|tara:strand:+ start:279 stop:443 length:165 start_codon:yes stop_codon:yes gene_type:complete
MNPEPELIDIFAMFALMTQKHLKGVSKIDAAYEAYEQAQAMIDVRKDFIKERSE